MIWPLSHECLLVGVWMNFDTLGQILVDVDALDGNIVGIDTFDTINCLR